MMRSGARVIGVMVGVILVGPSVGSAELCCVDDPPQCVALPASECELIGNVVSSCNGCEGATSCQNFMDCDDDNDCTMGFCIGVGTCDYDFRPPGFPCTAGPCTTGSCDGVGVCQTTAIPNCGTCCGSGGGCSEIPGANCNGVFLGGPACGAIGACCLSDSSCIETSESCCNAFRGSYREGPCLGDNNDDGANDACQLCSDAVGRSCDDGDVCTFDQCGGTDCRQSLRWYGDVAALQDCVPDGRVDADDILAVLDAFSTLYDAPDCPLHNFDIASAGGPGADGTVGLDDILAVVDAFMGQSTHCDDPLMPLPIVDGDGDGIPADQDPCWFSAGGVASTIPGCTALDVSIMPDTLVEWVRFPIAEAKADATELIISDQLASYLFAAEAGIVNGAPFVRSAGACEGAGMTFTALDHLDSALNELDALHAAAYDMIYPPDPIHADHTPEIQALFDVEYVQQKVTAARANILALDAALAAVCNASQWGVIYDGTVTDVDDVNGLVTLDTGGVFALRGDSSSAGARVGVGMDVALEVTDIGGGSSNTGMINGIMAEAYTPGGLQYVCMQLRLAPIQPFGPLFAGPYELHHPIAYYRNGVYLVEAGMGLAVVDVCPLPSGSWSSSSQRHSARLTLDYQDMTGNPVTRVLAFDLREGDHPVLIPSDADPSVIATLTVQQQVQECFPAGGALGFLCTTSAPTTSHTVDLDIKQRGSLAIAQYAQTEYDVDDQIQGDYRPATISNVLAFPTADGGFPPLFSAKGYGVPSSACPSVSSIIGGGPFAIHTWDFYPIYGPSNGLTKTYYEKLYGVTTASGLIWPHVGGLKNGSVFWYSCGLPPFVTRDAVNLCASPPNAYYRMPFSDNFAWEQSQGNGGAFSHAGGFAYDMVSGCGSTIRAARGGVVTMANGSCNIQQVDGDCPNSCGIPNCCAFTFCCANQVRIRHQDGTVGQYVHFGLNEVFVDVGDVVPRGQILGSVGSTGFSTGPHLHFAERSGPTTSLALFEARTAVGSGTLRTCYEPQDDDTIISNNQRCFECQAPCP